METVWAYPLSGAWLPPGDWELEAAILRTLCYADVFDYALTPAEIHRYLICHPATLVQVEQTLATSVWLAKRVDCADGSLVTLRGRGHLAVLRRQRQAASQPLWAAARRWGRRVGCLPFVRMVAVTGSLAMDNARAGDDVDLLVVTEPGRVWLARALTIGLVYVARLWGVRLCPNYVLARTALYQEQQDLFVAHDLLQMVPVVGQLVWDEMRELNAWAEVFLPQAGRFGRQSLMPLSPVERWVQRLGEWLLSGVIGDALEHWEFGRKLRKFGPRRPLGGRAVQLDSTRVKGHFADHRPDILRGYEQRWAQHQSEGGPL